MGADLEEIVVESWRVEDDERGSEEGFAAMADVERMAIGRRPSRSEPWPPVDSEPSLLFSVVASLAVLLGRKDGGGGLGVFALVGVVRDCCEAWAWDADWERWRMESSEGLRRRS